MIDRDTVIAMAEKHAICTSSQHKEFLHDELIAFVGEISQIAVEAERAKLNDAMDSFWTMLKECETNADNNDDRVLKHWVEAWHSQYARITGREIKSPRWIERARGTGGEG